MTDDDYAAAVAALDEALDRHLYPDEYMDEEYLR